MTKYIVFLRQKWWQCALFSYWNSDNTLLHCSPFPRLASPQFLPSKMTALFDLVQLRSLSQSLSLLCWLFCTAWMMISSWTLQIPFLEYWSACIGFVLTFISTLSKWSYRHWTRNITHDFREMLLISHNALIFNHCFH